MASHECPPLSGLLRFGSDAIESDPIGRCRIRAQDSRISIAFSLDLAALRATMRISGLIPEEPDGRALDTFAQEAVTTLRENVLEWQREWLTQTLVAHTLVSRLTLTSDFLRWLETQGRVLHRWLCVPAIQARIGQIRNGGTVHQRRRLATLLAGRSDGRPIRLPDERIIYHAVKRAETDLAPLADYIAGNRNREAAWLGLVEKHPQVAEILRGYDLDRRWFFDATGPAHRTARTNRVRVRTMAEELVAAKLGSTSQTVRKLAARVRERRRVK